MHNKNMRTPKAPCLCEQLQLLFLVHWVYILFHVESCSIICIAVGRRLLEWIDTEWHFPYHIIEQSFVHIIEQDNNLKAKF